MKLPALLLACLCSFGALAGTLPRDQVSADAKWLIHLDVAAFLETQLGKFAGRELLEPQANKMVSELRKQFDLDVDWHQIRSVTAYGMEFKEPEKVNGVVLIRGELDVAGALTTVLEKLEANGAGAAVPLRKVQDEPYPIFCFQDSVYGAPVGKQTFAIARSRAQLEKAQLVISGQAPSLTSTALFAEHAGQPAGFLTVAIADAAAVGARLPPQARVLKDTQGAQLVAGERANNVFVNAALEAKDSAVAEQIQQALQGVIAFAKLSDNQNKDLQQLAQAAKVGGAEKTVTLDLQMPVTDVIEKVGKNHKKKRG